MFGDGVAAAGVGSGVFVVGASPPPQAAMAAANSIGRSVRSFIFSEDFMVHRLARAGALVAAGLVASFDGHGSIVSAAPPAAPPAEAPVRAPDVPYEPTPPNVLGVMLTLGDVKAGDVVYDLGCGDGRVVIAAVKRAGVRGVCVDIDPKRIREARRNAAAAGVAGRIEFRTEDLFQTRIDDATVV